MDQLTVTIIQSELFWEDKAANLAQFTQKIEDINQKTELIILPEMFSTRFSMQPELFAESMNGETISWMHEMAMKKRAIITGSVIIKEDNQYFNRLIWMLPNGQTGYYNKRHLFAYGKENDHYTPGNRRFIATAKGWRINLQICYDLRFPVWARQQGDAESDEYDVLIYVANWPDRRVDAWKTLLQARAIENQCFTIGVNRVGVDGNEVNHSGDSMIVDPMGKVLFHQEKEEVVHTHTLEKQSLAETRNKLNFLSDRDQFLIKS